ncbi:MAG: hypothetical protein QM612_06895, partial [Thermomonas sp.]
MMRWFALLLLAGLLCTPQVQAQVQRRMINPSFEQPVIGSDGCRVYIDETRVTGWTTTHPYYASGEEATSSTACTTTSLTGWPRTSVRIVELWNTPRSASSGGYVVAPAGDQIAELNAVVASRLYQNVCLINNESFNWHFSHRGRGGTNSATPTAYDVANFVVGTGSVIATVSTSNAVSSTGGYLTPVAGSGQGAITATPVAVTGTVGNSTVTDHWVAYSGSYTYSGATGINSLGFEAVTAVGGANNGNLLDNIQIELAPFVDFTQSSSSTVESSTSNVPTLRINGTVYTAFTVTVDISGGTAVLGTDYTTPNNSTALTVTVPAGDYDGTSATGSLIALPITVVNNTTINDGNRTINLQIAPSTDGKFLLLSSTTCGGAATTHWTYTIIDDDTSITVAKSAAAPVAVTGQPTQLDITYTITVNNPSSLTATYNLVDTPGMDADASIVQVSSTRSATDGGNGAGSGGGSDTPTLTGSGPWTLASNRSLPAAATDTYVVVVRIQISQTGTSGNDACTTPSTAGNGLHNNATATLSSAETFTADACQDTPSPVWVTLTKNLTSRAVATDQVQIRLYSGGILNTSATTTDTGTSATTGTVVLTAGSTMQFTETVKTSGTGADTSLANYDTSIACSNTNPASTTPLPSGSGTSQSTYQAWDTFTPTGADNIACTITNTRRSATLTLAKQWTNAVTGDDATLTVARGATVLRSFDSDAGAASELDTDTSQVTVYAADVLTLAETLASGNTGLYNGTLACTGNANALSGSTLTVAGADTAIVCTWTNTHQQANLSITKSNNQSALGPLLVTTTEYVVVLPDTTADWLLLLVMDRLA